MKILSCALRTELFSNRVMHLSSPETAGVATQDRGCLPVKECCSKPWQEIILWIQEEFECLFCVCLEDMNFTVVLERLNAWK